MPRYLANTSAVIKLPNGDRRVVRVGRVYDPKREPAIAEIVALHPKFFDALEPVAGTETADGSTRSTEIPWPIDDAEDDAEDDDE